MKELKTYDAAAKLFYETQNIKALPLLSWDIYGQFLSNFQALSIDVVRLNDLSQNWSRQWDFKESLLAKDEVILVTDPELNIVFSSMNISKMNGYKAEEVLGRTPRMFQGAATCKETSSYIRNAVEKIIPFTAKVVNYRKDGSLYDCYIQGYPVHDKAGKLINFIAFEKAA